MQSPQGHHRRRPFASHTFAVAPTIWEVLAMLKSNINAAAETYGLASTTANDDASRRTAALLEELLVHSIKLRDLYKSARWQTADIQFRALRALFDDPHKEQLRLVGVLPHWLAPLRG